MKRIIRLTENDLTKLIKRILVESELKEPEEPEEPELTNNNYYESFNNAYSFMLKLDEYLNNLDPSKVCDKKHLNMLQRIEDTADKMVLDLRNKYKSTIDQPSEKAFADGSIDQKINDFIKKYDYLPDTKFYEFAKLFYKKFGKLSKPTKWDDNAVRKDPLNIEAQKMGWMAGRWLDCCKKGYYDCNDDDDYKL